MSENSPRWPGKNGSPGLDFSPRKPINGAGGKSDTVEAPKPGESRPDGPKPAADAPKTPPVAKAPQPDDPSGELTVKVAPRTVPPVNGAKPTGKQAEAQPSVKKPASPAATKKAVTTAKEWAAVPVKGMPKPPVVEAEPKVAPVALDTSDTTVIAKPTVAEEPSVGKKRRTRKARLRLSRIDPWSVMKTTLLFSIAFGVMLVVAAFVVWSVLEGSGALESANTLINSVLSNEAEGGGNTFKIESFLTVQRVMGFATLLAVIDAVIITAVATLFAFLYNLAATVMGGLEVTLAED